MLIQFSVKISGGNVLFARYLVKRNLKDKIPVFKKAKFKTKYKKQNTCLNSTKKKK